LGFNHFAWSRPTLVFGEEEKELAARTLPDAQKEMQSTGWVFGPLYFQTFSSVVPEFQVNNTAFAEKHGLRVVWPSDGITIDRPVKVLDDIDADNASRGLRPNYLPNTYLRRAGEIWRG
jgi:hypothetical protein